MTQFGVEKTKQVRDGRDRRAKVIGRYCNTFSFVPIISKSTSLYVKFKSDLSISGRGFKARYETRKVFRCFLKENLNLKMFFLGQCATRR